ncbi:hypothetical protein V6N13_000128 [Hibiscus sabdariffa]
MERLEAAIAWESVSESSSPFSGFSHSGVFQSSEKMSGEVKAHVGKRDTSIDDKRTQQKKAWIGRQKRMDNVIDRQRNQDIFAFENHQMDKIMMQMSK